MVARNTNGGIGYADHTGYRQENHYSTLELHGQTGGDEPDDQRGDGRRCQGVGFQTVFGRLLEIRDGTFRYATQNRTEAGEAGKEGLEMAKRVTPEEIVQIQRLYAKYGNFATVGREMGRSGSTVAKYVKLKGTPPIVAHTFKEVVRGA
mgnify:CR=1 FL=1